jgi:hypothetical protein
MHARLGEMMDNILLVVRVGEEARLGPHLQPKDAALLIFGAAWLHPHFGDALGDGSRVLKLGGVTN